MSGTNGIHWREWIVIAHIRKSVQKKYSDCWEYFFLIGELEERAGNRSFLFIKNEIYLNWFDTGNKCEVNEV